MIGETEETNRPLITNFSPTELTPQSKTIEEPFVYTSFRRLAEHGPPLSKQMLVIGSGENTNLWKGRGAKTLDIDPRFQADFVTDANHLAAATGEQAFNIVLAEAITIDPEGKTGVNFEQMVNQATIALKPDGELFIQTATMGSIPEERWPIPNPQAAMKIMLNAGLRNVAVYRGELTTLSEKHRRCGDKTLIDDFYYDAQTIYYGKKQKNFILPIRG